MPVLFDSVNADTFPTSGFDATAGYVNGKYQSSAPLRAKFPYLPHITITVFASGDARCLDVEPGDATVDQAAAWLDRQYGLGQRLPIIYTGASNLAALKAAIGNRPCLIWSAHWTKQSHVCGPNTCGYPQADATQWTDGTVVDQTLMTDHFFQAIGGDMAEAVDLTPAAVKAVVDALYAKRFPKAGSTDTTSLGDYLTWNNNVADLVRAIPKPPTPASVADIASAVVDGIKALVFKAS